MLQVTKFDDTVTKILTAPFPQEAVCQEATPKADGFRPSYIPWDLITKRLDEAFGGAWSWEIVKTEIQSNTWLVHGRLSVPTVEDSTKCVTNVTKDGFGTAAIVSPTSLGDDLKSACTEALKRAAVLLGVGAQLYRRDNQVAAVQQQAVQATAAQQSQAAQPFQIEAVRKLFAPYNFPPEWWAQSLQVSAIEQITSLVAAQLLSGQHPIIGWLQTNYPQVQPQSPRPVATSNA